MEVKFLKVRIVEFNKKIRKCIAISLEDKYNYLKDALDSQYGKEASQSSFILNLNLNQIKVV